MKTIKIGDLAVSPYPTRNNWQVIIPARHFGRRMRKTFSTQAGALDWASRQYNRIVSGGITEPLPTIGQEDRPLAIQHLVKRYLTEKQADISPANYRLLTNHLGKLVKWSGKRLPEEIKPLDARQWIKTLQLAQRTKFGVFSTCRSFFRWASRYGMAKSNPFEAMEPIQKGSAPKGILTTDQMEKLLETDCRPYLRAWLVLGGFCGLRTEEILRLDWSAVNLKTNEIHVGEDVIKKTSGMRERYTDIPDNAQKLLRAFPKSGKVVPVGLSNFAKAKKQLHRICHLPRNCLRHSAASYRLALVQDAGKVAHWLGHTSPAMVHSNYARAVTKDAAMVWWGIGKESR